MLIFFDVLRLEGTPMTGLPWHARREALEWVVPPVPRLEVGSTEPNGAELWRAVQRLKLEGIVAKRREAVYEPGKRSRAWVKLKTTEEEVLVAGGWVESPAGGLTALVLGEPSGARLCYRGHVAFGMDGEQRALLGELLPLLAREGCPFDAVPPRSGTWSRGPVGPTRWVEPELRVRVRHYAGAGDGLLRDAVFLGLELTYSRDTEGPAYAGPRSCAGKLSFSPAPGTQMAGIERY